ncbi:hypothetical protein LPMP_130890 [Leishmania panamensis]|uniref:Uncharacterized protein n=1 Tax=Leishmania panamensis TaxID=5679 RepID=A0A088RKQ3_LEIPA|nr:hypothetical protein LPMP_130890 [Leishmania panamensis]AIN96518.1 hypothetical protein LPMP_130890 [Leishmania panamensis]
MMSSASTRRGGAPATSRAGHPARSNTSGNANTSGERPQRPRAPGHVEKTTSRAGTAPQAEEPEKVKYTVIITNVENDFGKLHKACLPYYCGLRSDYEETLDVERLIHEGGPQSRRLIGAVRGCSYAVRCRTETRSAEISLYGPANADFSPMQLNKTSRRPPTPAGSAKSVGAPTSSSSAKPGPKKATVPAEDMSEGAAVANVGAVEQLALRLRQQHYFEEKVPVRVHLPGRIADEVLVRVKKGPAPSGTDGLGDTTVKSEERVEAQEDADVHGSGVTPLVLPASGEKRQRVYAEDNNNDASSPQRVKREAPEDDEGRRDEDDATAHKNGETAADDVNQSTNCSGRWSKQLKKSVPATIITQFPRRQKDFVTAVAALSCRVPLQRVRSCLRDLPGYLSCWCLYEQHLRVVFRDAESLFKAKQLLDQFELEPGLRVSLIFSDPLSRANAEFVRAQEMENASE